MTIDKWGKNGGLYFGYLPAPPKYPDNELEGVWAVDDRRQEVAYVGDRHAITFGPNGSGKSWRFLVPNLWRLRDWSIVVIDPKGELAAHTAKHRKDAGQRVMVIDPFRIMEQTYPRLLARPEYAFLKSHGYNPVAALDPTKTSFVDDAKRLADALIKDGGHTEKHWTNSARAFTKGAIMACRVAGGTAANLGHIRATIGFSAKRLAGWCKNNCEALGQQYPAISATLSRYSELSPDDREGQSILSTASTQTEWLDSTAISADLQGGADNEGKQFNFARLKTEPTTVYLVLPPEYLETHGIWLRVLINSIMTPLLRSTEDAPVPVLFMLDEYAALGRMEIIESNLALMRGYGVKLLPVLQDLSQLKDIHRERWESFISNAGVRHIFAPQDVTGQEYFSNLSGKRVWRYETASQNNSLQTGGPANQRGLGSNISENLQIVPTYYPQDLGAMQRGQGLLFVAETRQGRANVRQRAIFPDPRNDDGAALLPEVATMYRTAKQAISNSKK